MSTDILYNLQITSDYHIMSPVNVTLFSDIFHEIMLFVQTWF